MKTLLEILGISSIDDKERKVLQRLRDEAVQEKANDELNEPDKTGINDTLDSLREKCIEESQPTVKRQNPLFSPAWAIAFACVICILSFSFSIWENTPSSPANSSVPANPLASSNQQSDGMGWVVGILDFETPSLAYALPLSSEKWLEKPDINNVHAMLPIDSIASIYDELAHPTLPHFKLPHLSDPTLILYQKEGKRIKNDLQNGLGFLLDSLHSIDFEIEG